jgi:hypothetical protein
MTDTWTTRLSEYLDGDLTPEERQGFEAHLATCADCQATLGDLRTVVARLQTLDDRPPAEDLWPGIAAMVGSGRLVRPPTVTRRRLSFTVPQLLAASIALMILSAAGAAWFVRNAGVDAAPVGSPVPIINASDVPTKGYAAAVIELERVLHDRRGNLDSTTVRVLEAKLALIDKAIGEAERALAADPNDPYLHGHLADTRMQKLQLLRRAAILSASAS